MDHTDATNTSYPSLKLIAEEAGYDKTRACRYIDEIAKIGLITKSKRAASHGHFKGSRYLVNVGAVPTKNSNGPLAPVATVHLPPGQTKVVHSEGFTSEESQSSQTDGLLPTVETEKTKTDPVNYVHAKLEEKSSSEYCASPQVSAPIHPAVAKALADAAKQCKAICDAPMPDAPWKTPPSKSYLAAACDEFRKLAPGVELGKPLQSSVFKPLARLYDEHGGTALAELKNLMLPHVIALATATHVDQLERVLHGKPPGNPPAPEQWNTLQPFVPYEPSPYAGMSNAEITKLALKKAEAAALA